MMADNMISTDSSEDEEDDSTDSSGDGEEDSTDSSGDGEENSTDSSEDGKQGPCRKRRRLNAGNEICTEQGASPRESSDETETIRQERTNSDPLSDLTKDQRVVLYTLYLCFDYNDLDVDDDVTMGDIDVRRTLSELEERGLVVRGHGDRVGINTGRQTDTVISYTENCLLSDIDRDFYIQVASDDSLSFYIEEYPRPSTDTEESGVNPITLMRLVMEGRAQDILLNADAWIHEGFADVEFQKFMQDWCRLRNLDPMPWADEISYEEAVRFVSAYTILQTFQKGLWVQC